MFDELETAVRYSWTQPICFGCYLKAEGRAPVRMKDAKVERCCACGHNTKEGIYYRIDPKSVAFPTHLK